MLSTLPTEGKGLTLVATLTAATFSIIRCMPHESPAMIAASPGANDATICLDDLFGMRLLGPGDVTAVVECRLRKLEGRRLTARLSAVVPPDTCIKIECNDAVLYGEVLWCWLEGSSVFGAIELQQALVGLSELSSVFRNFEDLSGNQGAAERLSA
jgi:hypothetical protein